MPGAGRSVVSVAAGIPRQSCRGSVDESSDTKRGPGGRGGRGRSRGDSGAERDGIAFTCACTGVRRQPCADAAPVRPILVLDMYEHAFQMDYGAAAARYIEAYWKNVNWEVVERRFLHPAGQQGES